MAEFPRRNWSLAAVKRLLRKIDLWVMVWYGMVNVDLYSAIITKVSNALKKLCNVI